MGKKSRRKSRSAKAKVAPLKGGELTVAEGRPARWWRKENAGLLLAVAGTWLAGAWLRLGWISAAKKNPDFMWNGQPLPVTLDTFYFASLLQQSAMETPDGIMQNPGLFDFGLMPLLGAVAQALGFSVEQVFLYLPPLVGSLVVVPLVLLGRLYGSLAWGAGSALLAVTAFGYFNRTQAGYLDTDMLSVTLPMLILYGLLRAHRTGGVRALQATAGGILFYPFAFNDGVPIGVALALLFVVYRVLWNWRLQGRPQAASPEWQFTLRAIVLLPIAAAGCGVTVGRILHDSPMNLLVVLAALMAGDQVVSLAIRKGWLDGKLRYWGLATALVMAAALSGDSARKVVERPLQYLSANQQPGEESGPMIVEKQASPWIVVARRTSGSMAAFVLALAGMILLLVCHPEFLVALPLMGFSIFAHWAGHHFTVYSVPIAALALVFLPLGIQRLKERSNPGVSPPNWVLGALAGLTILGVWPSFGLVRAGIQSQRSVVTAQEVALLAGIREQSSPGDYVLCWWDWGTAVWYYAGLNVLSHPGNISIDNYVFAKAIHSASPRFAAHLGRLAVERHHESSSTNAWVPVQRVISAMTTDYFRANNKALKRQFRAGEIGEEELHRQWDKLNREAWKDALRQIEHESPKPRTRDAFLLLPYRLLNFHHAIWASMKLESPEATEIRPRLEVFPAWSRNGNLVTIERPGDRRRINLKKRTVNDGQREESLLNADFPDLGDHWNREVSAGTPGVNLICLQQPAVAVLVDARAYESLLIQMLLLGREDPEYFELVLSNEHGRVYRLLK